jgi:hypothetical protein
MTDIATAYNKYKFLGYEFLAWMWYTIENQPETLVFPGFENFSVTIGNRIVLENPMIDRIERITVKGEPANYDTGMLSLQQGAFISQMGLVLNAGSHEWEITINGESFSFTNFKTPPTAPIEPGEGLESSVLEKAYLLDQGLSFIDHIFQAFVKERVSIHWRQRTMPAIAKWIGAFHL